MKVLKCECGNDTFTWVNQLFRCGVCKNEYKPKDDELWVRRLDQETKEYTIWEVFPED